MINPKNLMIIITISSWVVPSRMVWCQQTKSSTRLTSKHVSTWSGWGWGGVLFCILIECSVSILRIKNSQFLCLHILQSVFSWINLDKVIYDIFVWMYKFIISEPTLSIKNKVMHIGQLSNATFFQNVSLKLLSVLGFY